MAETMIPRAIPPCLIAAGLALAACGQNVGFAPLSTGESGGEETGAAFTQFPDMPLPSKGDFDLERTMIFGGNDTWFGRLVINTSYSPNEMFDFYKENLSGYGWQEVTSLRSAVSVLTYSRQGRIATIQIQKRTIRGSEVTINVSPRGLPQAPTLGPPLPLPVQPLPRVR